MPRRDDPWSEAYAGHQDELEQMQGEASDMGLGALAGFMVLSAVGPRMLKGGLRRGLKRVAASRGELDDFTKTLGRAKTRVGQEALRRKALRKVGKEEGVIKRLRLAAAQGVKDAKGGRIDLSRTATRMGAPGMERLRSRGKLWRDFRKSDAVKNRGVLGALRRSPNQRRLLGSAISDNLRHQAAFMPMAYGVDTATGLTGGPGETPAWYDVPGHAANFVSWLPRYAMYEAAGTAAFAAPGLAKAGLRGVENLLENSPGAAKAISKGYTGIERMRRGMQRATERIHNTYDQRVATSASPARTAVDEGRKLMSMAKNSLEKSLSRRAQGARKKREYDLHGDWSVSGAREVFGEDTERSALAFALKNLDGESEDLNKLFGTLFAEPGEKHRGYLGRLFGAKAARLSDVEDMATERAQRDLGRLKEDIESFKQDLSSEDLSDEARAFVDKMDAGNLRVHGMANVGGRMLRLPNSGDLRHLAGSTLDRALTLHYGPKRNQEINLFRISQLHTLTDVQPAVQVLRGAQEVGGQLHYFGRDAAAQKAVQGHPGAFKGGQHQVGFAIADRPGSLTGRISGVGQTGETYTLADRALMVSGATGSKIERMVMARHGVMGASRASVAYDMQQKKDPSFVRDYLHKRMDLGAGKSGGGWQRLKGLLGKAAPRRLFGRDSSLWKIGSIETPEDALQVADSAYMMRQALAESQDVYTRPELFKDALDDLIKGGDLKKNVGTAEDILADDDRAAEAARQLIERIGRMGGDQDHMISPLASKVRQQLSSVSANPDKVYNPTGSRRGQVFRQFIFEQAALGLSRGSGRTSQFSSKIDQLVRDGVLDEKLGRQAQAGLGYLDVKRSTGLRGNPYDHVRQQIDTGKKSALFENVREAVQDQRGTLETFAQTRPRVDAAYHRRAFTDTDLFGGPMKQTGLIAMEPSAGTFGMRVAEGALDTTREALSFVGLGWDRSKSLSNPEGRKHIKNIWKERAKTFAAGYLGYHALDTAADVAIPSELPFGEGVTAEGADLAATMRLSASALYDATGITEGFQYLEGLAPKSTSTLPGAALGYYLGGAGGAMVGAAMNRMTSETLKDTPLEALSVLPPFAPFVSDMTESYDETKAKYSGEQWVPVRKGRYFLLSSSDYAGGRIEQWRPNWYAMTKGQPSASPVQYGSKLEQVIHRDLPLIDFSVGDIFDPHYLQKKQYHDRPYVAPDIPFSDVPIVGPQLGRWAGQAYNAAHPMASNASMHQDAVAAGVMGGGGWQSSGYSGSAQIGGPIAGQQFYGQASTWGDTVVSENTARASYDEQIYRITEAMGFTGFVGQRMLGGEGVFRDPIAPSASAIDSTGRGYHDLAMGDMLGIGEAARRLYPFERNAERYGPPNTQPEWMPEEYQWGDPYCLLPETLVEVDQHLVRADEAFDLIEAEPGEHYARTHKENLKPFVATAQREVDEEVLRVEVEGLPWPLVITKEHPVRIKDVIERWRLADNLEVGDRVVAPGGYDHDYVVAHGYDLDYMLEDKTFQHRLAHSGVTTRALMALLKIEPHGGSKYMTHGPSAEELYWIDYAFEMPGSKYDQREKGALTELRRRMAERGLPESLIGAQAAALRPLVRAWSEPIESGLRIDLTPERLQREPHPAWSGRSPYEPHTPIEETMRQAAYTLYRAFLTARTPAELEQVSPDHYRLTLRGKSASRYLFTEHHRQERRRETTEYDNEQLVETNKSWGKSSPGYHRVTKVERFHYQGPVYAFQVEGDESFVAAGVATHNSKIKMGEALLPGAGYESTGGGESRMTLDVRDLGATSYETALKMLDIDREEEHPIEKDVARRMRSYGAAVREESVFVDEQRRLVGVAAAATRGGNPIHIEALSDAEFRKTYQPRELDTQRVNALMGAAKRSKGHVTYVNEETGEVQSFVQQFDSGLYNETVRRMQEARVMARQFASQGYGAPGATYGTIDRLKVLMNADPFGDEWRVEMKKAKALGAAGALSPGEATELREVASMHDKMGVDHEMYPERFGDVFNPSETYQSHLNYNDNVKAASEYSLPERIAGSAWEKWTNLRTPLHTKFFGAYSIENQYERMVLLGRDFQSWSEPIDDMAKPYMRGLAAADDPLQGALSYGVGGMVFGGGVYGWAGAGLGTLYGAVKGVHSSLGGDPYIPSETNELRELESRFDRIRYYRAKRLYDATGDKLFQEEMQRTAIGWTQDGLSGTGWAKERRRSFSPSQRLESGLYGQDQGFGSPWRGLRAIEGFTGAIRQHSGKILTLGERLRPYASGAPRVTGHRIGEALRHRPDVITTPKRARRVRPPMEGFAAQGLAAVNRSANTRAASNLGFGSPWQGSSAAAAILYSGDDPLSDRLPSEMYTGMRAVPDNERAFFEAGLLMTDPEKQERFLSLVSPDMGAMLETGWNYLHGRDVGFDPMGMQQRGVDAGLAAHPVMGMGADVETYELRTIEDLRLDAHDAGLGWKQAEVGRTGQQGSPVGPHMRQEGAERRQDIRPIIIAALSQLGLQADVTVDETGGPTEIHIQQQT